MKKISKIKVTLIFISVIIGFIYATPNFISNLRHSDAPNFLPGKTINLGLDLKGGSYLLLKADMVSRLGFLSIYKELDNR